MQTVSEGQHQAADQLELLTLNSRHTAKTEAMFLDTGNSHKQETHLVNDSIYLVRLKNGNITNKLTTYKHYQKKKKSVKPLTMRKRI